jgi:hypothetical protein
MSDPATTAPDEELLEFLGDIDEANDETPEEDFADFLARGAERAPVAKPAPPARVKQDE